LPSQFKRFSVSPIQSNALGASKQRPNSSQWSWSAEIYQIIRIFPQKFSFFLSPICPNKKFAVGKGPEDARLCQPQAKSDTGFYLYTTLMTDGRALSSSHYSEDENGRLGHFEKAA